MKFKFLCTLVVTVFFVSGCAPYFMLDEEGRVEHIIQKYSNYISNQQYDKAFEHLTFIHQPQSKDFEMFRMAQDMLVSSWNDIEYNILDINIFDNLASAEVNMLFTHENPEANRVKVKTQFILYKPENSEIWFIVSGNEDSREVFLNEYDNEENIKLIKDKTYISSDGEWKLQE
ncbi:MAG: hypothetical protein ACQESP_06535 [Candidatus Muiribacteriota bacterium]